MASHHPNEVRDGGSSTDGAAVFSPATDGGTSTTALVPPMASTSSAHLHHAGGGDGSSASREPAAPAERSMVPMEAGGDPEDAEAAAAARRASIVSSVENQAWFIGHNPFMVNNEDLPPQPVAYTVTSLIIGLVMTLAAAAAIIYRIVASIMDDCFFNFTDVAKDFDKFQETGSVCDAPPYMNWILGVLIGIDVQVDAIGMAIGIVRKPVFVGILLGAAGVWEIVRIVVMIVFLALPLPFWTYSFPVIIMAVLGAVVVVVGLLAYRHGHEAEVALVAERRAVMDAVSHQVPGADAQAPDVASAPAVDPPQVW